MGAQARTRVAVVFGGRSSEHAISCISAGSVLGALDRDRYEVVAVGITPDGRWVLAADDPARLVAVDGRLPTVDPTGAGVALLADPGAHGLVVLDAGSATAAPGAVDVVFPVLHGPYGEDGTIQGLLELAGLPYVGSGVLASAVGMDKEYMKLVLAARGLPVGPFVTITDRDWRDHPAGCLDRAAGLGLPAFVKPARAGSSVGITRVTDRAALGEAVETARAHDPKVLVEAALTGREIECGVLEGEAGGPAEASVPAEIRVVRGHDFYDFAAKYLDDGADLDVPADLHPDVAGQVRAAAVRAFEALGCESLARVDFFVDDAVRPVRVVVNEVNTMPGFTPISMFPRMWAASGLDYPALVDRLVRTALARRRGVLR